MKIIGVMSGKGGVGKTTISVKIAQTLSKNYRVGIFDADITGSNIITEMGKIDKPFSVDETGVIPAEIKGIQVFSLPMYKRKIDRATPILRDGNWKSKYISDVFESLNYDADYLIIDFPPGFSDEMLTLLKKIKDIGIIVVTTGDKKSLENVNDTIEFLKLYKIKLIGIVENMGYINVNDEKINLFNKIDIKKILKYAPIANIPFNQNLSIDDFKELCEVIA